MSPSDDILTEEEAFGRLDEAAKGWPTPNRYTEAIDWLRVRLAEAERKNKQLSALIVEQEKDYRERKARNA